MFGVETTLINVPFMMGVFAFFVVCVSLLRLLNDQEFHRLTTMKRFWGRKTGIVLHFITNVCLPLICGVVFLTQGIVAFAEYQHAPRPSFSRSVESFVTIESQRIIIVVAVMSVDFLHLNERNIAP
jgi:hypothetical protein